MGKLADPKEFQHRLVSSMAERGISGADLARRTGLTEPYISQLRKGHRGNPTGDTVAKLADALDVSTDWLLAGVGPRTAREIGVQLQADPFLAESVAEYSPGFSWAPLFPWRMIAEADAFAAMPIQWPQKVPVQSKARDLVAFDAVGDAMEPRIFPGDTVVAMPGTDPRPGCMVAAATASGVVLRRFQPLPGDRCRLIPYNPLFAPTDHDSAEFRWLWPVHSVIRREWSD